MSSQSPENWFPPQAGGSLWAILLKLSSLNPKPQGIWGVFMGFLKKIYYLFIYFIHFWLCQVLFEAGRIFVEACGIFRCSAQASLELWHAGFLFSSCGPQVAERIGSAVCGTWLSR